MERRYIPEIRCPKCGQAQWYAESVLADPKNLKNREVIWKPVKCAICSDDGATLIPDMAVNNFEVLVGNTQ